MLQPTLQQPTLPSPNHVFNSLPLEYDVLISLIDVEDEVRSRCLRASGVARLGAD